MCKRIVELETKLAAVNICRKSETAWRTRLQEYVGVNADVACSHDPGGLDVEKGAAVCRKHPLPEEADDQKQLCGHPVSAIVSSGEGTNYCGECANQEAWKKNHASHQAMERDAETADE